MSWLKFFPVEYQVSCTDENGNVVIIADRKEAVAELRAEVYIKNDISADEVNAMSAAELMHAKLSDQQKEVQSAS